jgi:hypothetical protein
VLHFTVSVRARWPRPRQRIIALKSGFLSDTGATTETATDAKFNRVITLLKATPVNDQVCRSLFPDLGR